MAAIIGLILGALDDGRKIFDRISRTQRRPRDKQRSKQRNKQSRAAQPDEAERLCRQSLCRAALDVKREYESSVRILGARFQHGDGMGQFVLLHLRVQKPETVSFS